MTRFRKGKDYRKVHHYKYQLLGTVSVQTNLRPRRNLATKQRWVTLMSSGFLTTFRGYCWDGPSGPTFDTASTLRASLFHDALYQMMREGLLDPDKDRLAADDLLYRVMREDGAGPWRARLWLWAVRWFAKGAAK